MRHPVGKDGYNMKAVIMAGGEGSRLRPLTCDIPKPMARLCGRPALEYILDLLGEHGFREAALTVRYLPHRIAEHFPQGSYGELALRFVEETSPLGTAGSVRNACGDSDDGVLIISGDALCDFDLSAIMAFHKKQGADVTIVAKKVGDPREYGLINADESGVVQGFIEKPAYSQAVSDLANTGIYVLSRSALALIPTGKFYDFAKDLFPLMLEKKMRLMCYEGQGYWCDIGDLDSYISCQLDMLLGRVRCRIPGHRDKEGSFIRHTLGQGVTVEAPVYVGENVRIEDGALLERGTVVDDGSFIGAGARVSGSILLPDSFVDARARLTRSLVCAGAAVKRGAMLFEGATVGAGGVVGEKATVNAGVKIWNKKTVPDNAVITEHVKTDIQNRGFFDDDGITGDIGVELTAEFCARVGAAIGSMRPDARIAVGCSAHRSAAVLKMAMAAGIQSTGTHVMDFGENFQAQFEFSMNFCNLPLGVFIKGGNHAALRVMGEGGLPATRSTERSVESVLARGEFVRCSHENMGDKVEMPGMGTLYRSQLIRCAPKGLSGLSVQVRSRNMLVQSIFRDTVHKLGCDLSGNVAVEISGQGDKVRVYVPEMGYIQHHKILAWCAVGEMERGMDVALPFDAPRAIDDMAGQLGRRVLRYLDCPADDGDAEARELAKTQTWSRDGLQLGMMFLTLLRRHGSIEALLSRSPRFDIVARTVDTGGSPAAFLRGLSQARPGKITEGVLLRRNGGTVLVRPLKRGQGLRVLAEAYSSETAAELCEDVQKLIQKGLPKQTD